MKFQLVAVVTGIFLLSGCATIVSGTTQMIKVDSNPQGAQVFTATVKEKDGQKIYSDRKPAGVTPVTVAVERKDGAILVEKAGFDSVDVPLHRSLNNWVFGDVALLSLLSTSIDTSTGASNQFDPGQYLVELKATRK